MVHAINDVVDQLTRGHAEIRVKVCGTSRHRDLNRMEGGICLIVDIVDIDLMYCRRTDIVGDEQALLVVNLDVRELRFPADILSSRIGRVEGLTAGTGVPESLVCKFGLLEGIRVLDPDDLLRALIDTAARSVPIARTRKLLCGGIGGRRQGDHVDLIFAGVARLDLVDTAIFVIIAVRTASIRVAVAVIIKRSFFHREAGNCRGGLACLSFHREVQQDVISRRLTLIRIAPVDDVCRNVIRQLCLHVVIRNQLLRAVTRT